MGFIRLNRLDKNFKILLLYMTICCGCFLISRIMGGVAPFDFDFFDSICQLIIFIPLLIYEKIEKKEEKLYNSYKKKQKYDKNNYKDYIIFILIIIINFIYNLILLNRDISLLKMISFISTYNLEILFIKIINKFYSIGMSIDYIHQYIHQIIITLLSLGIDFIIYKYNNIILDFPHIILLLLVMILHSINISYKKYLIEIKNFSVYILCTLFGIFNLIFYLIIIIIKNYNNNFMCFNESCLIYFGYQLKSNLSWIKLIVSAILCIINYIFFYKILYHYYAPYVLMIFIVNNFTEIELTIIKSDTFHLLYILMYIILTILFFFIFFRNN